MNVISDTALFTCSLRARDAASSRPICGDHLAGAFVDTNAEDVFRRMNVPARMTASISTRHRIIDDVLCERLASRPKCAVVILGCGFDTRAFRLTGGHWHELDEPQIIEIKNAKLDAAKCSNALQRIGIRFATDDLLAGLPAIEPSIPVIVVMEGVLLYLDEKQIERTMTALRQAYPEHVLICDCITRQMAHRHSTQIRAAFESVGAVWKFMPDDPVQIIEQFGYRFNASIPIIDRSLAFQRVPKPVRWIAHWLMPDLKGLAVHVFQTRQPVRQAVSHAT